MKHIQELAKLLIDLLVQSALHWWAGVGNDRSIGECIVIVEKLDRN